jgi:membrane protease YdiL (CAAX protease family)
MSPYLEVARQGKNEWWRYLLSLALILLMWFMVGSLPVVMLALYAGLDGNPQTGGVQNPLAGLDPLVVFVASMLTFVPLFLTTLFVVRFIHQRPVRTLITAAARIRWSRMAASFGVWLALGAVLSIVEELLYPGRYELTFQPGPFLAALLPTLILIPIQTSAEELFIRGYLMQGLGQIIKPGWIVAVITAGAFALLHFSNPEVGVSFPLLMAFYFAFGLFAAIVTLLDGGLELALGIHFANNFFTAVFANYSGSAIESPSIFTSAVLDPVYGLVAPLVAMAIFCAVFFILKKSPVPAEVD